MITRRQIVRTIGSAGIAAALAGCGGEEPTETATTSPTETDSTTPTETTVTETAVSESTATESTVVDVGPEGRLRFVPADIEVSVGDTVKWVARSEGHNVTSHPDAAPRCENPEGAEPFTSYEGDAHFAIMEVGEVFTHEFTVPGEYVYVCTPHAGQGMVGTVTVNE